MIKPITPADIKKQQALRVFPDYVIEAFNNVIAKHMNTGTYARFTQNEVVEEILKCAFHGHGVELPRQEIFNQQMLDVEEIYRADGWKVDFDKGAYYEENSWFTFEWKGKK